MNGNVIGIVDIAEHIITGDGVATGEELELADCFCDFREYLGKCRFPNCSHTKEKGCAVIEAVNEGKIARSRHESYINMYEQAKQISRILRAPDKGYTQTFISSLSRAEGVMRELCDMMGDID